MGDVRFYPSQSNIEQSVTSELAEYALVQRKMPYKKMPFETQTILEAGVGEQYSDIRKIMDYISQHAPESAPAGHKCERTQLLTTEFVMDDLSKEDRIKVKNHLISNCNSCLEHVVLESRLHKIARQAKTQEN